MLGLNGLEESVYRRILRRSGQRTQELVYALDFGEAEVRVAISRLLSMSLIRRSPEDDDSLLPVSPEVAVGSLLAGQEARLLRQQLELQDSRASLAELVSEYAPSGFVPVGESVQRLEGVDAVCCRTEELVCHSSSEISLCHAGPRGADALEASSTTVRAALKRGVHARGVYLQSSRNHAPTRDHLRRLAENGAQIRTTPVLPLSMLLFDRRTALLPLEPPESGTGAWVLTGGAMLVALLALFEHHWESATPFHTPPKPEGDELTPAEQQLLRLFAAGLTDEAVGRQLGVSPRTVRRRIRELTGRLGAASRFQAGVLANRRGWI